MLATKARAILGEAPAMESAQLPSGHPAIRWTYDPMPRWPDGRMTIGSSHKEGIKRSNASAFRRTNSTTAERGFMLATKARAILGEAPATESAQFPSGHPTIRWSYDPMPRWPDDPMTIGSSHKKGIKRSNASAFRRTNSTTAERGFMLATKARTMLGEAPAKESAQLSSGHPAIRSSGHFHAVALSQAQGDPMIRWPDGRMTIGSSHQAGIKESNTSASRRTNSTTAERGFMLATKARAILGEAPATKSAQLSSGHPAIRSADHPRGFHGKT